MPPRLAEPGVDDGYAVEYLTGTLPGLWYSSNDLSIFRPSANLRRQNELMKLCRPIVALAILCFLAAPIQASDKTVTLRSLLQEMADRDRLPQLAVLSYVAGQASSYDRASVAPDKPGWFANHDFGMYVALRPTGCGRNMS